MSIHDSIVNSILPSSESTPYDDTPTAIPELVTSSSLMSEFKNTLSFTTSILQKPLFRLLSQKKRSTRARSQEVV